jgi:hypothetical protein
MNKCCACGNLFHPYWWTNFEFHERDEELHRQVKIMWLDELHDQLKQTLQEEVDCPLSLVSSTFPY